MPTAYTAILGETEDMKLKDFALLCARNFGALYCMKDEPLSAPIPERFESDDYYKKELDRVQKEHDDFLAMSDTERKEHLERTYDETVKEYVDRAKTLSKEKSILRKRYNNMLYKVVKWNPPTPEHSKLRDFMIDQIHKGLEWDCKEYELRLPDKDEWCDVENHINNLKQSLKIAKDCYENDLKATEARNEWLAILRESLKDCD